MSGSEKFLASLLVGCLFTYGVADPEEPAGPGAEAQEPFYRVSDEPRLQIGSANDGESALYRVTAAVRLRDGRIVVANAGTRELKFFDSSGVHLASTGQRGDGPGDFEHLGRIGALEDGRVAVMDMLLGRVSVFSADGVHERTYRVSRGLGEAGSRIEMYGFLANGTLVGLQEVVGEGTEARYGDYPASALVHKAPVVQPVLIDTLGQAVPFGRTMPGDETLSEMQTTSGDGTLSVSGIGRIPMPFLNSAAVDVRDTLIVFGHTSGFDLRRGVPRRPIRVYDAEGEGRVFFTFGLDASAEVPEGARQAWVDRRISTFADRGARRQWRSRYEEFMSATPALLPRFKSLVLHRRAAPRVPPVRHRIRLRVGQVDGRTRYRVCADVRPDRGTVGRFLSSAVTRTEGDLV